MSRTILYAPSHYGTSSKHYLIFFITGNPGLIGYYRTYFNTLNILLSSEMHDSFPVFHIFGQSLAGFGDANSFQNPNQHRSTPYGLQEQIEYTFKALKSQRISAGERQGDNFDSIILMGHSVGAYILLELLRLIRQDPSAIPSKVKAGILLFPTVTQIAQSPSGVKISALFRIPDFPKVASSLAKILLWPFPRPALRRIVATVTGMDKDAAEVTTDFLISKGGIWQALHLARDEMRIIREDAWDEDIWGVETGDWDTNAEMPTLIFYFGENDHWVANHTRDALIAARGHVDGYNRRSRPKMLIDKDGIPHGFCINHSELVAEKVKVWIDEIVSAV